MGIRNRPLEGADRVKKGSRSVGLQGAQPRERPLSEVQVDRGQFNIYANFG